MLMQSVFQVATGGLGWGLPRWFEQAPRLRQSAQNPTMQRVWLQTPSFGLAKPQSASELLRVYWQAITLPHIASVENALQKVAARAKAQGLVTTLDIWQIENGVVSGAWRMIRGNEETAAQIEALQLEIEAQFPELHFDLRWFQDFHAEH
jgi:hypothetical protein